MHNFKSVIEIAGMAGCVLLPATAFAQKATSKNPNIIYILADDLGYGELGCYGSTKIKTPHLDAMAANGMRFTQNYSGSAVSGPSRSCLVTGQHAGYAWTRENNPIDDPLPASAVTFAEALKAVGYKTGAFGKWGVGNTGTSGAPWLQGFDTFFGYLNHDPAHNYYPDFLYSKTPEDASVTTVKLNNNGVSAHPSTVISVELANDPTQYHQFIGNEWSNTRIKDEAVKFIRSNQDQKFMAYIPFTVPHLALQAPLDSVEKYYGNAFSETPYRGGNNYTPAHKPRAMYATMITLMDVHIGQIMAELKTLGLDTCTLIMFSSDNGATNPVGGSDVPFFNSNGGLRGTKYTYYEGGIRVPLIAYWPGKVPAGETSGLLTHIHDILPTIVEVGGGTVPESSTGISLVPTIFPDRKTQKKHTHLYWETSNSSDALQAVRSGKWKLIRKNIRTGENFELYDLEKDRAETTNLAKTYPDTVSALLRFMRDRSDAHLPHWNFPVPEVFVPEEGAEVSNNALAFNGTTDWVELQGFNGVTGSNARTVEAWIKTSAPAPGDFISWGTNTAGKKWTIRLDNASPFTGRLRLEVGSAWAIGTKVINDGQWHHIAITYPGGKLSNARLYVDGMPDAIVNIWESDVNTAESGAVQISKGFHGRYWQGEIDELRFWNVARTAEEIYAAYNCPLTNPTEISGLVRYYNFNRTGANVLPDLKMNTAGRLYMPVSSWVESQAALCNTAVEKFTTPGLFQIQPNPATGKFYVFLSAELQGPLTVQIFDATAKLLYSEVFQNPMQKYEISPGNQYKGILQVRVKAADKCQTQKLIMY
ncbi:MAG: sulfatase-like hydrolase/transferase [Paludibacteraceae bacterium]|nr:sulfatase-like hydrolase/transferase [Paludibacteraceae bacterium]